MAFKKMHVDSTKYSYARIEELFYRKDQCLEIIVNCYVRDSQVLTQTEYEALTVSDQEEYRYASDLSSNGNKYEKVPQFIGRYKHIVSDFINRSEFSISVLSQKDNNMIKACYIWLKNQDAILQDNWEEV